MLSAFRSTFCSYFDSIFLSFWFLETEITTTDGKINVEIIWNWSTLFLSSCYNFWLFVIIVRFIPAPGTTTTEGKMNVKNIWNCSTLFYFCVIIFFSLIIIVRFIAAPEITTTEGKINVTAFEIAVLCSIFML